MDAEGPRTEKATVTAIRTSTDLLLQHATVLTRTKIPHPIIIRLILEEGMSASGARPRWLVVTCFARKKHKWLEKAEQEANRTQSQKGRAMNNGSNLQLEADAPEKPEWGHEGDSRSPNKMGYVLIS